MRVNLDLTATINLLGLCGGCALAILDDKIHQSGGFQAKGNRPAAFSMLFFWCVLYLALELGANMNQSYLRRRLQGQEEHS
jgi:hypothetical protein